MYRDQQTSMAIGTAANTEVAARKYLSASPISVASEQLFSSAGQLYAARRSSLLGENAEKQLFLACLGSIIRPT